MVGSVDHHCPKVKEGVKVAERGPGRGDREGRRGWDLLAVRWEGDLTRSRSPELVTHVMAGATRHARHLAKIYLW